MNRRQAMKASVAAVTGATFASVTAAQSRDDQSQASLDTVMALMGAMGSGDMGAMADFMADDMVWLNAGDPTLPWIGPWEGKQAIFGFLGVFSENFQTTKWENTDVLASGDTVAIFGDMNGITTKSGQEIGDFTFALRAKVRDGKVVLWNWFEDSFAVSQAYHAK
ncbi:MAG: nuclear transport factor 2 family protein [Marinosulfonomonas sp.]